MWFRRKPKPDRWTVAGQRARRRASVLNVSTRLSHSRGAAWHRVAALVLVPVTLAVAVLLAWFGLDRVGRVLFAENPRFTLRTLAIEEGAVVSRALIQEWTQVREGMNLFGFEVSHVRESVLRRAPNVKSLEITRLLPDTLHIRVVERLALARVGARGSLVADREGAVFSMGVRPLRLPIIEGCAEPDLRPGQRLDGMALAALELIETCDEPRLGVRIDSVSVNQPDHLLVRLLFEERPREVELFWDAMGAGSARSREALERRLGEVLAAFRSEEGRGLSRLDATFAGKAYGTRE